MWIFIYLHVYVYKQFISQFNAIFVVVEYRVCVCVCVCVCECERAPAHAFNIYGNHF